jgi:hypothetical protein
MTLKRFFFVKIARFFQKNSHPRSETPTFAVSRKKGFVISYILK